MKYLIVYLIKKEAAHYVKNLSDELANVFNLEQVSLRIPPHLTLKSPFDGRDATDVKKMLERFAATHKQAKLTLQGFDNIDRRLLYMDVKTSPEAAQLIAELSHELQKVPWLRFDSHKNGQQSRKLHATLAYAETRQLFSDLSNYIKDETATFDVMLDNIAILEREKDSKRWRLSAEYEIPA
jgi:2'-5' RNA ligase